MHIERHYVPDSTIEQFADKHGLVMVVRERGRDYGSSRFYAMFKDAVVADRECCIGVYGNGATEEEAISAYALAISEKTLMVNAYQKDRRYIPVPRFDQEKP